MSDEVVQPKEETVGLVYQQLCTSYHAIDDFRAKLLGFLPLATGTGIVLLFNKEATNYTGALGAIGVFGFVITLGLFAYELYGARRCGAIIVAGKRLEARLNVEGHFHGRPRELAGFVNEPFASGIIYPAVLAAWIYLALYFASVRAASFAAGIVFLVGFIGSIAYNVSLRNLPEEKVSPERRA